MKSYKKVNIYFIFLLLIFFISLGLSTYNYCRSKYDLEPIEENDPEIYLTGLKDMEFYLEATKIEYYDGISNLGKTGKLEFDCYLGKCEYDVPGTEDIDIYNENSCSNDCRINKGQSCMSSSCHRSNYIKSMCEKISIDDDEKEKSCDAKNLILFWKKHYFKRINLTTFGKYTYSNSAISANEKCEQTGRKMCGILDSLGNKLCYPENEECPINFVTKNKSEIEKIDKNYKKATIKDVGEIYFTNKLVETGKVAGGFFVDTDLLIRYTEKDCEIFDTGSISELLNIHYNKLYVNNLNFDPYSEKDIDSKGKAYLKLCTPEPDKERNINKIKLLVEQYNRNVTFNEDYVRKIKQLFTISYFIGVSGYCIFFTHLLTLGSIILGKQGNTCFCECNDCCNHCMFIYLIFPSLILLGSVITSMCIIPKLNFDTEEVLDFDLDKNLYNWL